MNAKRGAREVQASSNANLFTKLFFGGNVRSALEIFGVLRATIAEN